MIKLGKFSFLVLSLLLATAIPAAAEESGMQELAATVKKMNDANTQKEVKNALSQLEELDKKAAAAVQPPAPVSTIPVPGQPAPVLKNYPAPVPSVQAPPVVAAPPPPVAVKPAEQLNPYALPAAQTPAASQAQPTDNIYR